MSHSTRAKCAFCFSIKLQKKSVAPVAESERLRAGDATSRVPAASRDARRVWPVPVYTRPKAVHARPYSSRLGGCAARCAVPAWGPAARRAGKFLKC